MFDFEIKFFMISSILTDTGLGVFNLELPGISKNLYLSNYYYDINTIDYSENAVYNGLYNLLPNYNKFDYLQDCYISYNNKVLTWYTNSMIYNMSQIQFNGLNYKYFYIAIG